MFNFLNTWITEFVEKFSYFGILILLGLENIIPPIPSELILPLAGFQVNQGRLNLIGVIIFATVGSILGSILIYYFGVWLGKKRAERLIHKIFFISDDDFKKGLKLFERHGDKMVFLGRFIPGVRSLISLPAGIYQMSFKKFLILTGLGSLIWNSLLIFLGWGLGEKWEEVSRYSRFLEIGIVVILILWIIYKIFKKK